MQTDALATREIADALLLIRAFEVEAADVGARRRLETAHGQYLLAVGDFLPHRLRRRQGLARLIDEGELHRRADDDLAAVGLLAARDHAEQRRLARAVRSDDADDGAGWDLEAQLVDEQAIAVGLRDILELDD